MASRLLLALLVVGTFSEVHAQSAYAPPDPAYYHRIDRYEVRQNAFAEGFHSAVKPYERRFIAQFADSLAARPSLLRSAADRFNVWYLQADNFVWSEAEARSERPLGFLYRRRPDAYFYGNEDVAVHFSPVLHAEAGNDSPAEAAPFYFTRGVQVHGHVDRRVGFYAFITENLMRFPTYVDRRIVATNVVPHEGFWKFVGDDQRRYQFFTARGHFTFSATRHIQLQFGHDRNQIGHGMRSMVLSDYANNYTFLKVNTRVWRVNYTNLFAQLYADVPTTFPGARTLAASQRYPRKYLAFHRLGFNITKNLNAGISEAVVFGSTDSTGGTFDVNYLNPVIFYRSVEQQGGSPDNALIAFDVNWMFLRHFRLYGQLLIDEFVSAEVRGRTGWWGNKQAGQVGLHYVDAFGVPNLDLQGEFNVARPYTYGHNTIFTDYAHYNQPLAHPLGANFREWVGVARYQPWPRLELTGRLVRSRFGADSSGSHWGGDVRRSYDIRERQNPEEEDRGHFIGQGVSTTLLYADLHASYQVRHNVFLDLRQIVRQLDSALDGRDLNTSLTTVGVRWNLPARNHFF